MELHEQAEPEIYMPTEAATATAPDGRKLVFFTVPQAELLIKRVLASRPKEYTYRWAYHPAHQVHVLLAAWPSGDALGVAIPEGAGDAVLHYMLGTSDLFITTMPVQEKLQGTVSEKAIQEVVYGTTLFLPEVKFKPEA